MDILFIADNFPPEGNAQASRVYERACYWAQWGHKVTVITCAPNFPEGVVHSGYTNSWYHVEEMTGIRVVRTKSLIARNAGTLRRALDFVSFMFTSFAVGLFQKKPDVIVATSPQFFAAISGCLLALMKRVPFVMEVSDLWPDSIVAVGAMKPSLAIRSLEKIELAMYARAERVVLLTYAFRENLLKRGVPEDKLDVVRSGADLTRYSPRSRDVGLAGSLGLAGCFTVGYIGTLGLAHALDNVLQAAALVRNPNVRFLFVGAGADREHLIAKCAEMNLQNVVFVPARPKYEMPRYWSVCDASLVHLKDTPLFKTVIPSKIFEAMAMGLPIVLAAPQGEAAEIVRSENAGVCVPAENPQALADAVTMLAQDPALRDSLARASHQAAPLHSRETQATQMLLSLARAVGVSQTSKTQAVTKERINELVK